MDIEAQLKTIAHAYKTGLIENDDGYSPATHSFLRPDVIHLTHEILEMFRRAFTTAGWDAKSLREKKGLEVGCAWGLRLNQILGFNLNSQNLHGIDLMDDFIVQAKEMNPRIDFQTMSATALTFDDRSFDFSYVVMGFSAMLSSDVIEASLKEMCRVTKEFVLIIDNFIPEFEQRKKGLLVFKGVNPNLMEKSRTLPRVKGIHMLGSFWTVSPVAWKLWSFLRRAGLERLAFPLAIGFAARKSHRAYVVQLAG